MWIWFEHLVALPLIPAVDGPGLAVALPFLGRNGRLGVGIALVRVRRFLGTLEERLVGLHVLLRIDGFGTAFGHRGIGPKPGLPRKDVALENVFVSLEALTLQPVRHAPEEAQHPVEGHADGRAEPGLLPPGGVVGKGLGNGLFVHHVDVAAQALGRIARVDVVILAPLRRLSSPRSAMRRSACPPSR